MVVRVAVDRQPPLIAPAWGERQGADVRSDRHPDVGPRLDSYRPTDLELPLENNGLLPERTSNRDGYAIAVDQFESPAVLAVGLIPRDLDMHGDGGRPIRRRGDVPTTADDRQLPFTRLRKVGQEHGRAHDAKRIRAGRAMSRTPWALQRPTSLTTARPSSPETQPL
jgi:hypothetical protein